MPSPMLLVKESSKSREFLSDQFKGLKLDIKNSKESIFKSAQKGYAEQAKKEENKKDGKIMDLQMQVGALRKENMELRLMLNYFMQLSLVD
jgi:uncharacterized membrane protein